MTDPTTPAAVDPQQERGGGDAAAQVLMTFLDGMPTPKEQLNAAIRTVLDERGRRHAGTNLGAGSSQMGPGDEAAGRVLAFVDAWRAVRQSGDSLIKMCVTNDGPVYLDETDLRTLLDERGQLLGKRDIATQTDRLTIEGLSALHQRAAAERDEATARAEQAEAELDGYRAQLAQWAEIKQAVGDVRAMRERAARTEQAEAEVERLKARVEFAWNEGDRLTNDLVAAVFGDDARRGEFQQKWSRIAALGDPEPEYRYLLADGTESEFDLHNGLCDCQRQVRDVYVTPWRSAERRPRQPHEPIRDQQDVDDLAAAEGDRLSDEEFASFQAAIAECRGEETEETDRA